MDRIARGDTPPTPIDTTIGNYLNNYKHMDNVDLYEAVLAEEVREGNLDALGIMMSLYDNMILPMAKKYLDQGLPIGDLKHVARIGLLKAASRYHHDKNAAFKVYALWWMKQSLEKAVAEQVRINQIPDVQLKQMEVINRNLNQIEQQDDDTPTSTQLEAFLEEKMYEPQVISKAS